MSELANQVAKIICKSYPNAPGCLQDEMLRDPCTWGNCDPMKTAYDIIIRVYSDAQKCALVESDHMFVGPSDYSDGYIAAGEDIYAAISERAVKAVSK